LERVLTCAHCQRRINRRDDLVVALVFFSIVPYHTGCYARALRGCQSAVIGNEPINGVGFTVAAVIGTLTAIWVSVEFSVFMGIIFLLPAGIRLYSLYTIERAIE